MPAIQRQMTVRPIDQIVRPQPTLEGAGVHLLRTIGTRQLTNLDPFLLLDHFESSTPADYRAGFPFHPHRGIETVTILRTGQVQHGDSLGHKGTINGGDIQWMTSGSGILHEEMPIVRPEGIAGLQLWLNLPAREKMTRPKYRDLRAGQLVERVTDDGATLRVIAGAADSGRSQGPVTGLSVAPKFIDVSLPAGAVFREEVTAGHTAFAYLDRGRVSFGEHEFLTEVTGPALVVFGDGDFVRAESGGRGGRFLLAAARPLHEPIARYGPFVMNTPEEVQQTLADLRSGRFIREEAADA
jgi:redox-sensitive bicupin YhaK (pirin superfamily)